MQRAARSSDAHQDGVLDRRVIPVVEEAIEVTTERVETGAVRVRIEVDTALETIDAGLREEVVTASVVPRGIEASVRLEPYEEGDDLVVPVYEERLVIAKRLFLKEEVRLTRLRRSTSQTHEVPVRRERAIVERQQPDGSWAEALMAHGPPRGSKPG